MSTHKDGLNRGT